MVNILEEYIYGQSEAQKFAPNYRIIQQHFSKYFPSIPYPESVYVPELTGRIDSLVAKAKQKRNMQELGASILTKNLDKADLSEGYFKKILTVDPKDIDALRQIEYNCESFKILNATFNSLFRENKVYKKEKEIKDPIVSQVTLDSIDKSFKETEREEKEEKKKKKKIHIPIKPLAIFGGIALLGYFLLTKGEIQTQQSTASISAVVAAQPIDTPKTDTTVEIPKTLNFMEEYNGIIYFLQGVVPDSGTYTLTKESDKFYLVNDADSTDKRTLEILSKVNILSTDIYKRSDSRGDQFEIDKQSLEYDLAGNSKELASLDSTIKELKGELELYNGYETQLDTVDNEKVELQTKLNLLEQKIGPLEQQIKILSDKNQLSEDYNNFLMTLKDYNNTSGKKKVLEDKVLFTEIRKDWIQKNNSYSEANVFIIYQAQKKK